MASRRRRHRRQVQREDRALAEARDAMRRAAEEAFQSEDFELAAHRYQQAIDAGPGGAGTADLYRERALALARLGDYEGAIADIDISIELDPSTIPVAYLIKGYSYIKLYDYHRAKEALKLGYSHASGHKPKFTSFLNLCQKYIDAEDEEIQEAFNDGNLQLAVELCSDAIKASPETASLYCARAKVLIKLGEYNESLTDASKAIAIDSTFVDGYLMKGLSYIKVQDYGNAVSTLLDCPYAANDPRLICLLEKCLGQMDDIGNNILVALIEKYAVVASTPTVKLKYKHVFYNRGSSKVVLSIFAKNVPNEHLHVEFREKELNVSILIPGEEEYHFKCSLYAEIIPEQCKFKVSPKEVEIQLAKAVPQPWTCLSESSIPCPKDFEFSWVEERLNQMDIIPQVHNQGREKTCIFHALTCTTEMELKRQAANRKPPESSKVRFSANDFASEFDKEDFILDLREGLKFFKEKGVLTLGKDVERVKYRIRDYKQRKLRFKEIQKLIKEGRPVVGAINVDSSFGELGPNDIFDYDPKLDPDGVGHAVVFTGYGWRDGRAYLVFLNSYGSKFSSSGFGRIYFDHVHLLHTIDV